MGQFDYLLFLLVYKFIILLELKHTLILIVIYIIIAGNNKFGKGSLRFAAN